MLYPGVSPIDLAWGDLKAGYMKIVRKHPEVVGKLQDILTGMRITSQSDNRIVFESDKHKMVVSKMKGSQPTDNWLLTAYEKKEKPVSASSSDIETEPEGKRNGTATPQNGAISEGKDSEKVSDVQEGDGVLSALERYDAAKGGYEDMLDEVYPDVEGTSGRRAEIEEAVNGMSFDEVIGNEENEGMRRALEKLRDARA
ncbi:MAG: hypothetical protein ACI30M_01690 [Muribaculaceae bacterium]